MSPAEFTAHPAHTPARAALVYMLRYWSYAWIDPQAQMAHPETPCADGVLKLLSEHNAWINLTQLGGRRSSLSGGTALSGRRG